jgi:hypothetical protein
MHCFCRYRQKYAGIDIVPGLKHTTDKRKKKRDYDIAFRVEDMSADENLEKYNNNDLILVKDVFQVEIHNNSLHVLTIYMHLLFASTCQMC